MLRDGLRPPQDDGEEGTLIVRFHLKIAGSKTAVAQRIHPIGVRRLKISFLNMFVVNHAVHLDSVINDTYKYNL